MSVAISCDGLFERNLSVEIVELLCELYEPDTIYALAHRPGQILGPIEQRRVSSSFLSRVARTPRELTHMAHFVPMAAKKLTIPCRHKLVINVSTGLSHGITRCRESRQITYLLNDWDELIAGLKLTLKERFFAPYVRRWAKQQLRQADVLLAPTEALAQHYRRQLDREVEVVPPFIKLGDFPLISSSSFRHDYYLLDAPSMTAVEAREWWDFLQARGSKFLFVGAPDGHLDELKRNAPERFLGQKCSGELAPLLAACCALINGRSGGFPRLALCALSCGRPVVAAGSGGAQAYFAALPEGVEVYREATPGREVEQILQGLEGEHGRFERQKLHSYAQLFGDLKFKHYFRRKWSAPDLTT